MQLDNKLHTKIYKNLYHPKTPFVFILIQFFLFFCFTSSIRAVPYCTYRTWNSDEYLYFQMVTYPELWNYTHIYFDTNSTEPTSASNDNESLWNLGTWADYNSSWEDKWCGIRSTTGYDMGCNTNNWPAIMPTSVWTFTGVNRINQVYIAVDDNPANTDCTLASSTPTPSPSPIPVTKVFVAPGFGASWNADAILNCKKTGYSEGWTLAPYAKSVYEPLLDALGSAKWTTMPFYYDWRTDVRENATQLESYINTSTSSDEKVDVVGHSMGGLVGEAYLETADGEKASKFLAVGAPNQGSALAYPLFSDGEIWMNDIVEKIAATLYVNHCGIPAGTQNLLPTYDYLRNATTQQLKPVSSLTAKNNWLPINFTFPSGVKVGALVGTGLQTLNIIDVANPSRSDIKAGNWIDGKPVRQEYSVNGDGTVLTNSAQVPGASVTDVINQSHTGLVASSQGISEILRFLGSPGIADPVYKEPTSALVIAGYPGNFWVKDSKGKITQSDNGLVTFFNPGSGDYELQVIPQSSDTLIIIEQILPNNINLYKEYHIKGTVPQMEEIIFDSKHPSVDILRNKTDYKKSHFPEWGKIWWNLWEKLRRK